MTHEEALFGDFAAFIRNCHNFGTKTDEVSGRTATEKRLLRVKRICDEGLYSFDLEDMDLISL